MKVPELSEVELFLRLALAVALGGLIGVEREWRDRTAGLRTHILVCLGSAAFTIVSAYGFREWAVDVSSTTRPNISSDPTRIAAQIVTGIGFLGAGAIFRSDDGVRGLTTAASLWIMAAIGLAVGAGYYELAIEATVLILLVLIGLRQVSHRISRSNRGEQVPLEILVTGATAIGSVLDAIAHVSGGVSNFTVSTPKRGHPGRRLTFDLTLPVDSAISDVVGRLALLDGVDSISASEVPIDGGPT
ncbi:MAG: MgtC/SapB family protein [Thermoleophilia bacterium]|nr:MgtC/SapB family protein [Thermoleophilia bacterium]